MTGLKQRPGVRRFQLSSLPDLIQAQSASLVARIDDDVDDNDDKITQTWISSRDIDTDEYSVEYCRKHVQFPCKSSKRGHTLFLLQQTRELIRARKTSHKQQRPESPTVTFI